MRRLPFYLLLFLAFHTQGQALRDINYKYMYDPGRDFSFSLKPVRTATAWETFFELQILDSLQNTQMYSIDWSVRKSLSDKEGVRAGSDSVAATASGRRSIVGSVKTKLSGEVQVLAAFVTEKSSRKGWYFYTLLDPGHPGTGIVMNSGNPVLHDFVTLGSRLTFYPTENRIVSYYNDVFPPGTPAFAEATGKVSKTMRVDSTFSTAGEPVMPDQTGLYLFQKDTLIGEGISMRVENDYPRLRRMESLADPLVYVCTRQEYERIKLAKGDKKAFDKIILSITGDAARARNFMRNYFKRVEFANQFFTSYKEGWKTDRGMIYIVFGVPDEVFRFSDREVWNYKNDLFKANFEFVKAPSLFDPENFVLIRNKKYTQTWYEVVDLWRNSRF